MREDFDRDAIRQLNDDIRQNFEGGQVLLTPGVLDLPAETLSKVLRAIRVFDDWTEDCDPWGLHDFGQVEINGHKVWFKVDAYDANMEFGSPNPADPNLTRRVMTVLLPHEY